MPPEEVIFQPRPSSRKKLALVAFAAILLLAAATAAIYIMKNPPGTFVLKDPKNKAGMSIAKPTGFKLQKLPGIPSSTQKLKPLQARFAKDGSANAVIALNSMPYIGAVKSQQSSLGLVSRLMMDPKDPGHAAVIAPMQNYVTTLLNHNFAEPAYTFNFSQVGEFKNTSISQNGWYMTFTAKANKTPQPALEVKGEVIEIYGSHGQYFAAFYDASASWQSDPVWGKEIASLRVDI